MPPSPASQVFMSYSRKDNIVAQRIVSFLRKQGVNVWVDNEKLIPGTPVWEEAIEKAIKSASAIIVILSPDSKSSEWVRREISLADQYRKRVFPVLARGDEETSTSLRLIGRQYVDIRTNEKAGLNSLNVALSFYLEELNTREEKQTAEQKLDTDATSFNTRSKQQKNRALLLKFKIPAFILALGFISYLIWQVIPSVFFPLPTATSIPTATKTLHPPTKTNTPVLTPTSGISTKLGEHGEILVYVPEGEFTMGSNRNPDEQPIHKVYLDAFWIDQTEVTNKQYQACVDAGKCGAPSSTNSFTNSSYFRNPKFDNYPVIYLSWEKANGYCVNWAGGHLPSEAQWEKAARGTDGQIYPWGETINCTFANYWLRKNGACVGDTTPVGHYEIGQSPYGAYDMIGNALEWVNDWYGIAYYENSPRLNPPGPVSGTDRVLKGGSWNINDDSPHSASRYHSIPKGSDDNVGFRCAYLP